MNEGEDNRDPVQVHVLQGVGYIWNADDALYLRKTCGLIGATVGGVAAFKQQNAVHGLPLQLGPEEVTLAVEEGWAVLCAPTLADTLTLNNKNDGTTGNKKRKSRGRYHFGDEDEDFDDEDDDGYYYQHHNDDESKGEDGQEEAEKNRTAPWQDALAYGTPFEVPTTVEEAKMAQKTIEKVKEEINPGITADSLWTFPSTQEERDSYLVFKDLHSRGFRITGGSKFGADFLLYPGDPTLYHAQFCVRLMPFKESVLPAMMAAACRGSFQARKHLLYASIVMNGAENEMKTTVDRDGGVGNGWLKGISGRYKVQYMTFGPVDGFG